VHGSGSYENVSPQLPLFGVFGNGGLFGSGIRSAAGYLNGSLSLIHRITAGDNNKASEESIRDSCNSRASSPFQASPFVFAALSLSGLIAAFKGVYRDSDFMIFGGTAVAVASGSVLMVRIISHLPLDFTISLSSPPRLLMLSHGLAIGT